MMSEKRNNGFNFKEEFRKDWYLFILVAIMFFASLLLYSRLPEKMPTHWNIAGEVDNYSSRFWGAFMMPVLALGILLLMLLTPLIDPRKENYSKFSSSYRAIRSILIVFFTGLHFLLLIASLGYNINIGKFVTLGVGVMFFIMGNYMPKVRHNYFLGIKVPWTLASDKVWKKTHRLAGKLFVISGIIMFLGIFFSDLIRFWLIIICAIGSSLVSMVYSYVIYRSEK